MPSVHKWLCYGCGKLLAFTNQETGQLQIKWKQLHVHVKGGQVIIHCRYCGTPNIVTDDPCQECDYLQVKEE
jgi:hypothetical protein